MQDLEGGDVIAGYKAVAKVYNALMTGLVLTLLSQRDARAAARYVFAHFRRQHLEKFMPGLAKLGLQALPHAVACAQYHYFSNALGGVKTEFMAESDRKAWVRYPPPRWIWQGTAICAVPREVNEAMLHGWHGHNGVSLGNPRLGFVCTGQTVNGDPGLEGYYYEYDRPLAPEERVRFAPGERAPPFDPKAAPQLASDAWPLERRQKVERLYAMEYVRTMLVVLQQEFGLEAAGALLGRTARLIGLQFRDEMARELCIADATPVAFAQMLRRMALAQGERAECFEDGESVGLRQEGWRLIEGLPIDAETAFGAWNALWEGALAAHDRTLSLRSQFDGARITWTIAHRRG